MNFELEMIKNYIGINLFHQGRTYFKDFIQYKSNNFKNEEHIFSFYVHSKYSYRQRFSVEIKSKKHEIIESKCNCEYFQAFRKCEHVAACLFHYRDEIFELDEEEKKLFLSRQILKEFYKPRDKNEMRLRKQIQLDVEVEFHDSDYYGASIELFFKIGEQKLYNFNNKLVPFLNAFEEEKKYSFGKGFTYDPNQHFFSESDMKIITFLLSLYHANPYSNFRNLNLPLNQFPEIFTLLKDKSFYLRNHGEINAIKLENPFLLFLKKKEKDYQLSIVENDLDILTDDFQYVAKKDVLYKIPSKVSKILSLMQVNHLHDIEFQEDDLDTFYEGILPIVKSNISIDESLKDKILLGVKPNAKIYLDLKDNLIFCDLKMEYQDQFVSYFEKKSSVVRDLEEEQKVIDELLSYGFVIQDEKIFMDDFDLIGSFLEESLETLAKHHEVFTTDQMKKTKMIQDSIIRSSFSIGEDNIMKYDFDLGDIPSEEIVNILENMKSKKKYYRLKSGDFLSLQHNDDLMELSFLMNDMDLSEKDIKKGSGEIPKYRAIYLDSLKKEKYHIINTNNLFDDLITKFNSYKDMKVSFSKEEQKILRDYQIVGVKWLYNIYKCGFGGILADEMGLGKSIQLIYFIKLLLKEKSNAKILIVAPTSLIYNWKNEFDKFGSELHYKVFAETKIKRLQELENIGETQIIITTYGLLREDKEIYSSMNFELVAIDEAQNIKNIHAQMTKVVKELHASTKIALTGTPLENSVLELWSIFDFIMPGYLTDFMKFQRKYNIKDISETDLKNLDTLNEQIKPFILRRKKQDVMKELPPKIENNVFIDLNQEQKKLYVAQLEKTKKEMESIIAKEGFQKGSFKILQLLTKLRQLCIDPKILYENYKGGSAKMENLVSMTKDIIFNGHKILLFTSFKTALDLVNQEFTNHNISTYMIDGSVPSKRRMELVEKFNHDDTNVFLITLKSGGTGLNLTSADVVIHLDLWWNPQVENQATDRAHRIGQTKTVEVIKLICKGTIEERILELQEKKKVLSDKLIEGKDRDQNLISKLSEQDIKRLLSMDHEEVVN